MQKPKDYNFSLIPKHILDKIVNSYGLTNPIYVPFIGIENEVFSISVLSDTSPKSVILTDDGSYFLKQIPWYAKQKRMVENRMNLMRHLEEAGVVMPKLILRSDRSSFMEIDGDFYYLTKLLRNTGAGRNLTIAHSLGEEIGKMHLASSEMNLNIDESHKSETVVDSCKELAKLLDTKAIDLVDNFTSKFKLLDYGSLKFYVHGDLNPSNIIFSDKKVEGFVDFDNAIVDNPVRDLAEIIITFCLVEYFENTSNIKKIKDELDIKLAQKIIEGYKEQAPHLYANFKHLLPEVLKIILLEIYLISRLRGFIGEGEEFTIGSILEDQIMNLLSNNDNGQGIHILDTFSKIREKDTLLYGNDLIEELKNKILSLDLKILDIGSYDFKPGYTLFVMLGESHIALHSWPELRKLHIDIFVCNHNSDNATKAHEIYSFVRKKVNHLGSRRQIVYRD